MRSAKSLLLSEPIRLASLIGSDKRSDLALLKVQANNLPVVKIASFDNVKLGEWVLAIGSPFGFNQTVTAGIVSGKQRKLASFLCFPLTIPAVTV